MDNEDGEMLFMACLNNCDFTPEQAIAATLGQCAPEDVDTAYDERIRPRVELEDVPTREIREWSVLAHSVMELTGPAPFGEDGNVSLWLHEKSLTRLFDMCDAVDKKFAEVEQAATLGSEECENVSDPPSGFLCSMCG